MGPEGCVNNYDPSEDTYFGPGVLEFKGKLRDAIATDTEGKPQAWHLDFPFPQHLWLTLLAIEQDEWYKRNVIVIYYQDPQTQLWHVALANCRDANYWNGSDTFLRMGTYKFCVYDISAFIQHYFSNLKPEGEA